MTMSLGHPPPKLRPREASLLCVCRPGRLPGTQWMQQPPIEHEPWPWAPTVRVPDRLELRAAGLQRHSRHLVGFVVFLAAFT
jgi:hypothetical protein